MQKTQTVMAFQSCWTATRSHSLLRQYSSVALVIPAASSTSHLVPSCPSQRRRHASTSTPSSSRKPSAQKQHTTGSSSPSTPPSQPIPSPLDPTPPSSEPFDLGSVKGATFGTSTSSAAAAADAVPLPFLSQPLGVPERPSSQPKTWAQKRAELVDQDRRLEKRKAIVKEATRGYFHDFHAIRSHGGKTWRSPSTLIRQDKALFFPNVSGTRLSDRSTVHTADLMVGKVSIVAVLGSQISDEHCKSFYEPTMAAYGADADVQLIQINLQTNPLKSYLLSIFLSTLRRTIPAPQQSTYLLSLQTRELELKRPALGLHNAHVGYTYLVDPQARIRWAGAAFGEEGEREGLRTCTGVLLARSRDELGKGKSKAEKE